MKYTAVAVLLLGGALQGRAEYVVDVDLGILPEGNTALVGTTAAAIDPGPPPSIIGGNNNSLFVKGLIVDGQLQTWGNEIVYQFELDVPALVSITSNSLQGDADFFLLDGLATSEDPGTGKISADNGVDVALLDGFPPQTVEFVPLRPGVYYLAVENYDGVDGNLNPGDTDFDVTLTVLEAVDLDLAIDLGPIAAAGSPLDLDTFGSAFNTELAIYDLFGTLLFENDDAGGGLQSGISLPDGLSEGTYYAVIAGHDTEFGPVFDITPGGEAGDWTFNFPLGPVLDPGRETGRTDSSHPALERQFFLFSIALPPSNPIELGILANENQPFFINTLNSDFDTQLAMFDSEGFWLAFHDDIDLEGLDGDPDNDLLSELDFTDGLLAGTYYLVIAGYPHLYGDGFLVEVDFQASPISEGGAYRLNHPLDFWEDSLASNDRQWFSFEVAALPEIDVTEVEFDSASNQFTVWWETSLPGPFNIRVGNAADLAALQAAPDNVLPIEAAGGVTSPHTFAVPAALQGESEVFFQVTD